MPTTDLVRFSLTRFLWRALLWAALGGFLWNATVQANATFTIQIAKTLQHLVGFPSPYMFCDERPLFWHATLFPPIVGLALASYWLRWPDRIARTIAGCITYAVLTAITIVLHESPYLPDSRFRESATSALVNANYLMFGLVIWMLAAGPWYLHREPPDPPNRPRPAVIRFWRWIRMGWGTRLALLIIGIAAVVPLFAASGSRGGLRARLDVARAMRQVPFFPMPSTADRETSAESQRLRDRAAADAIRSIEKLIQEDAERTTASPAMSFLCGHLYYSMRPESPALRKLYARYGATYLSVARRQR